MRPTRQIVRLANLLLSIYQQRHAQVRVEQQAEWNRLEQRVDEVLRRRRLMEKARLHGWYLAAQQQQRSLSAALRCCSDSAMTMAERCREAPEMTPRIADFQAELESLHDEFDTVIVDANKKTIAVRTNSIVLDETELGPFLIRLHWPRLAERTGVDCFEVVALDPQPASCDDSVVHPHVRNHNLCAGDATVPLQKATEQGRLTDAFQLIHAVLQTYNAESAYASLDDWEGVSCWSCGARTSRDDTWFCDDCDHDMCNDCISTCVHCDRYRCTACQTQCDVCHEPCCSRCLKKSACSALECCVTCRKACIQCNAYVAVNEIDDATALCPACRSAQTHETTASPTPCALPTNSPP